MVSISVPVQHPHFLTAYLCPVFDDDEIDFHDASFASTVCITFVSNESYYGYISNAEESRNVKKAKKS